MHKSHNLTRTQEIVKFTFYCAVGYVIACAVLVICWLFHIFGQLATLLLLWLISPTAASKC